MTSSREIAELCEKRHDNVVRDIRNMLDDLDLSVLSFEETYTSPQNGQRYTQFKLPKTLTTTLVSGYSTKLRYRIVKRWEELEAQQQQATVLFHPGCPQVRSISGLAALACLRYG